MIFELIIGIIMIVSALYAYIPEPEYMHELTFLSNMAGGCLFLSDYALQKLRQKKLPHALYLAETVTISIVFLIAVGGTVSGMAHFNFSGGMFFLHVINPILVMVFYLFFRSKKEFNITDLAFAPAFLLAFLLFDYIRFLKVHELVYGLFPADELTFLWAVIIGLIFYVFTFLLGFVIWGIGRKSHFRSDLSFGGQEK